MRLQQSDAIQGIDNVIDCILNPQKVAGHILVGTTGFDWRENSKTDPSKKGYHDLLNLVYNNRGITIDWIYLPTIAHRMPGEPTAIQKIYLNGIGELFIDTKPILGLPIRTTSLYHKLVQDRARAVSLAQTDIVTAVLHEDPSVNAIRALQTDKVIQYPIIFTDVRTRDLLQHFVPSDETIACYTRLKNVNGAKPGSLTFELGRRFVG